MAAGAKFLRVLAAEYRQLRPAEDEPVALEVWTQMVRATADQLAGANPRFEFVRFFAAAGVPGHC